MHLVLPDECLHVADSGASQPEWGSCRTPHAVSSAPHDRDLGADGTVRALLGTGAGRYLTHSSLAL